MVFDYLPHYKTYANMVMLSCEKNGLDEEGTIERMAQMVNAKSFSIDESLCNAINNSKSFETSYLPFGDILFFPENYSVGTDKLVAVAVVSLKFDKSDLTYSINLQSNKFEEIVIQYLTKDKEGLYSANGYGYPNSNPLEYKFPRPKKNVIKEVNNFVFGVLNFLNNPEVELVEKRVDKIRNTKRIKRGKIPLPIMTNIKINGTLKQYLFNFERDFKNASYSHRFWVRGHFRHLNSDKWKNKKGQTTWVVPYVKGKGILINKNYELKGDGC